jgi:hypothetical protein
VRSWLAWWLLLAALYLLIADSVVAGELVTAALAAAAGATGAVIVRRNRLGRGPLSVRWLGGAWRPLAGLVTDLGPLLRALPARGGRAALVELPPAAGSAAAAQALGSLAPNTIVVDTDADRVLVHRLEP